MSILQLHQPVKVSDDPVANGRIAGLDTLRAVLAVLVVLLHASMPYMLAPFPGLAWPVYDTASVWVDAVGWWADSFVMPTFLLLAGFSASLLMVHKGPNKFLSHRIQRVLVPLLFGMVVLLPIELYLWLAAWVGQGEIPFGKLLSLKLDPPHGNHLWGLSHLWFLEYLFLYSLIAWWMVRIGGRGTHRADATTEPHVLNVFVLPSPSGRGAGGEGATLIRPSPHPTLSRRERVPHWFITLLGGLIAGGVMCLWPRVLIGFSHGWLPHPANFICFGLIFACGWWLAGRHARGANVTTGCELQAAAGLLLFAIALPGLREFAALRDAGAHAPWTTAIPFGLSGWLSAVGWWGVFLKHFNHRPANFVCYLAESSFWLYLVHHPLVALLQIYLALVNWSSGWKFVTASTCSIAISLATYECLVRRTRLGLLLNGHRPAVHPAIPSAIEESQIDENRPRRAA